jgi:16S rRNA (guanine527-N7)-methyltransferase
VADPLRTVLERAATLGILGPGPIEPHVDHARAFARVAPPERGADLGSGAGVPAFVLALEWPDSAWTLIESRERRAAFLQESARELGLAERVVVVHGRAEDVGQEAAHRAAHDLVTARSFGPPAVTAECAAGLLRVGGHLVVSEPPEPKENRWPRAPLAELGLEPDRTLDAPRMQVLRQVSPAPAAYPRRSGTPRKRPLW